MFILSVGRWVVWWVDGARRSARSRRRRRSALCGSRLLVRARRPERAAAVATRHFAPR